jgi:hypothetical protein
MITSSILQLTIDVVVRHQLRRGTVLVLIDSDVVLMFTTTNLTHMLY